MTDQSKPHHPSPASHFWDRDPLEGWGDANESAGRLRCSEFSPVDLERAADLLAAPQPTRDAAEGAGESSEQLWMLTHTEEGMFITNDPAPFGGTVASPVWLSVTGLLEMQAVKIVGLLNRRKSATPKPAPDAMRERDKERPIIVHCIGVLIEKFGAKPLEAAWAIFDYLGQPRSLAFLAAPVPSPDGAGALGVVDAVIDQFENDRRVLYPDSEVLIALGKIREAVSPSSATGAAEPDGPYHAGNAFRNMPEHKGWVFPVETDRQPEGTFIVAHLYANALGKNEAERLQKKIVSLLNCAIPPVRGDRIIELDAWRPFNNFINDPLFKQIPDEEILTAGSALTRSKITYGELRELSRSMLRLLVRGEREAAHQTIYKHLYQALEKTGLSETFLTRDLWQATKLAADDLSLPVQPGAGERDDSSLLDWLNEQPVDIIYLDDGYLIDVKGDDVRMALKTARDEQASRQTPQSG